MYPRRDTFMITRQAGVPKASTTETVTDGDLRKGKDDERQQNEPGEGNIKHAD